MPSSWYEILLPFYLANRNDSREKDWLLPEIDCVKKNPIKSIMNKTISPEATAVLVPPTPIRIVTLL